MSESKDMYVLCIPLSILPSPPSEQKNCVAEPCPKCKANMWVSERKRNLRTENPDLKVWCGACILWDMRAQGIDPNDAEVINLLMRH